MKRFLIWLLVLSMTLCSFAFAESDDEELPDYDRMVQRRTLIGKDVWGDEIFQFNGMNVSGKDAGALSLINLDDVFDLLIKYNVRFASTYGTNVNNKEYYVIQLLDGSHYGLETISTYNYEYFIYVKDFEVFYQNYDDPNFVFDE